MPNDEPILDLPSLAGGLLDQLRARSRAGLSPAPGPVPGGGLEPLRQAVDRLRIGRDEAVSRTNDRYRERTDAVRAVVAQRRQRLEAYAGRRRQVVPPASGAFVVAGRVTDQASGVGLPHVRVRATDLDRRHHDALGETRTDALGYYRIEYRADDFEEADENPETFIEVLHEEGDVLFRSPRSFVEKAGRTAFIAAEVDGTRLPTSLRMADKITRTVAAREDDYARRLRVLERRADFTPVRVRRPVEAVSRPLGEVRGIGPTFRARLEAEGVADAREVAAMEPARLAGILGVGEARARSIVREARRTIS